jgi:hypothetical protein
MGKGISRTYVVYGGKGVLKQGTTSQRTSWAFAAGKKSNFFCPATTQQNIACVKIVP